MDDLLEYENLVFSIISKYGNYFDRDDLYQAGMIGLIDAYKHFDNSVGVKFSSYAYYYILGEVTKFVRENRSVKVGKEMIKLNSSIEKCRDIMRQRLGREPTDTEVSLFLEIDEEKIGEVRDTMQDVRSLDFYYDEDEEETENSNGDIRHGRAHLFHSIYEAEDCHFSLTPKIF